MKRTILTLAILVASISTMMGQNPLTKTQVKQGVIEGVLEDGLGMFKGIPYAEPPIGQLRWKEPVPAKAWKGTFKADTYQAMPAQEVQTFPGRPAPKVSEDCLYLNIMTPAKSAGEKLPVMVWIHGGGFITGSALSPAGNQIAKQGVVYVCIEYRTGALGFLALPELSKESPRGISGNYGMMDQILALKWVQENIAAFGGDPSKVTIFGESAGAIAVSMLCASPLAKGLFSGAISESGGSFCPVDNVRNDNNGIRDLKGAEAHGVDFMHRMGAKNLAELRAMPFEKWVSDKQTIGVGGFWPCVDGYVIKDDQYKLYEKGDYNDVNVLIGTNSDEGSMFVHPTSVEEYKASVRRDYGPFSERVLQLYPATTEEETFYAQSDIFRETAFAWPTFAWANLQKQTGKKNVYMYYFDMPQNFSFGGPNMKPRGAAHAMELSYVFNSSMFGPMPPEGKQVAEAMIKYWTNFAKTGNPNGEGLVNWPQYQKDGKTVMKFSDKGEELITAPNREQLDLMEEFFKWKRDNNIKTAFNSD